MKRAGFTLIELAITLAIIGLIIGGSFKALKMMRERNKIYEAKEQVNSAKDAVLGFAMKWVDLPTVAEFTSTLSPVSGTEKPILYFTDPALANNIDVCAFNTINLTLVDNSATPVRTINNIAFIVVASGPNYNMQTAVDTSVTPNIVNIYDPSTQIDDNMSDFKRAQPYDDIVKWVTLTELQENVKCKDRPLRIVNDSLPSAYEDLPYSATLVIDGNYSVPTSSSCTFTPLPDYNDFTYSPITYKITSSSTSRTLGVAVVNCTFTADGRTVSKPFSIAVNPAMGGGSGGTGTLPQGASCTADNQCQSGRCLPSNKCAH